MSELTAKRIAVRTRRKRPMGPMERMWLRVLLAQMGLLLVVLSTLVWSPLTHWWDTELRLVCIAFQIQNIHIAYHRWRYWRDREG